MRAVLLGASLLALGLSTAAYAQTNPNAAAPALVEAPGRYLVFFAWDKANLTDQDRQVIAQAVETYQRTGTARITATGYTDTSGSADYNLRLSQRRAEVVAQELIRQGVPAADITTIGRGEENLRVPTADGVREPGNRRVEIEIPQPPSAPVAAAPEVAPSPPPPPPPPPPPRFEARLGGLYGHNYGETDDDTENDLAGGEIGLSFLAGSFAGIRIDQAALKSFNGVDDGWVGRSVAGFDFHPNFLGFRPYIGINAGGVYGQGVQDGFVAGPEAGFKVNLAGNSFLYAKAAYDYQFRNPEDWDKGIVWGGAGLGFRW